MFFPPNLSNRASKLELDARSLSTPLLQVKDAPIKKIPKQQQLVKKKGKKESVPNNHWKRTRCKKREREREGGGGVIHKTNKTQRGLLLDRDPYITAVYSGSGCVPRSKTYDYTVGKLLLRTPPAAAACRFCMAFLPMRLLLQELTLLWLLFNFSYF